MKKLPLIFSVVSLIAVIALFVIEFTDNEKGEESSMDAVVEKISNGKIAYVEIDSIVSNFDMYFKLREELLGKQQSSDAELNARGSQYEAGAKDYEEKVRKGLVTRANAAQMQEALMQQQQELVNLRDQLQYQLMEEEQVMNRTILDYIYSYLEVYTEKNSYEYIFGKSFGGQLLYGNKGLDITESVLKGLNEYYTAEKE